MNQKNNLPSGSENLCLHQWIPVEFIAGCRRYQDDSVTIDWTSNIINAHYLRVTKLYCPKCNTFVMLPSDASDK